MLGQGSGIALDPKDPWALATGGGYDKEHVYTRATDGHGHSDALYIKVSPAVMACISEAIEKVNSYRSKGDFLRDAIIHRLHEINEWTKNPGHINLQPIDVECRLAELQELAGKRQEWTSLIETADAQLQALINEGDYEAAQYFIDQNSMVESMSIPFQQRLSVVLMRHQDVIRRSH